MLAIACGLLSACGDDATDGGGSGASGDGGGGDGAGSGGSGGGGAAEKTVTFTLTAVAGPEMQAVDGFEFCLKDDPDNCATTDADGTMGLEVPADSRVPIYIDKPGHYPLVYLLTTGSTDITTTEGYAFPTNDLVMQHAEAAGVTLDDTKGTFACVGTGAQGGTIDLAPAGGEGPFYWNMEMPPLPDPALDAFSLSMVASYYNLDPGDYTATVSAPARDCTSNEMFWAGDEPGALDMPIETGRWSWGCHATCATPGPATFTTTDDPLADAAACETDYPDAMEPACAGCYCDKCLDELNACLAEPGCVDVVLCAQEKDCMLAGCYTADTCMAELDGVEGGIGGAATMAATAWGNCIVAMCQPDSCTPAANQ